MSNDDKTPAIMGLEQFEIKIIELVADGLTPNEIGKKLSLKASKVDAVKKKLITVTGTRNTASLVSFAYRYGLLKI